MCLGPHLSWNAVNVMASTFVQAQRQKHHIEIISVASKGKVRTDFQSRPCDVVTGRMSAGVGASLNPRAAF